MKKEMKKEIEKLYNKTKLGELPRGTMHDLWITVTGKHTMTTEEFEFMCKMYLLGKADGIKQANSTI